MSEWLHNLTHRHIVASSTKVQGTLVVCGKRTSRKITKAFYMPHGGNPVEVPIPLLDKVAGADSHLEIMAIIRGATTS